MSWADHEDKMWLPDRSKTLLHKPGDSFYTSTRCGLVVDEGETVRATDHHAGFLPCGECWPEEQAGE